MRKKIKYYIESPRKYYVTTNIHIHEDSSLSEKEDLVWFEHTTKQLRSYKAIHEFLVFFKKFFGLLYCTTQVGDVINAHIVSVIVGRIFFSCLNKFQHASV